MRKCSLDVWFFGLNFKAFIFWGFNAIVPCSYPDFTPEYSERKIHPLPSRAFPRCRMISFDRLHLRFHYFTLLNDFLFSRSIWGVQWSVWRLVVQQMWALPLSNLSQKYLCNKKFKKMWFTFPFTFYGLEKFKYWNGNIIIWICLKIIS